MIEKIKSIEEDLAIKGDAEKNNTIIDMLSGEQLKKLFSEYIVFEKEIRLEITSFLKSSMIRNNPPVHEILPDIKWLERSSEVFLLASIMAARSARLFPERADNNELRKELLLLENLIEAFDIVIREKYTPLLGNKHFLPIFASFIQQLGKKHDFVSHSRNTAILMAQVLYKTKGCSVLKEKDIPDAWRMDYHSPTQYCLFNDFHIKPLFYLTLSQITGKLALVYCKPDENLQKTNLPFRTAASEEIVHRISEIISAQKILEDCGISQDQWKEYLVVPEIISFVTKITGLGECTSKEILDGLLSSLQCRRRI